MISKIKSYLANAIKKPVHICAMILDPTYKTSIWILHAKFIQEHFKLSVDNIVKIFITMAEKFENNMKPKKPAKTSKDKSKDQEPPPKKSCQNNFRLSLRKPVAPVDGIKTEITKYLKDDPEDEDLNFLSYWVGRQKTYPMLAQMAQKFLAIPATSAASERVFSKG
ncbi:hypothetical protein PCANC_19056 [Puccinia coronata f. sp. avenae]|uniref:HAT C-terminal dimerisation domain-containing protein n=1 Tax=Puccinia coronata f. sp. avenae TaxID=200324 RepID=A0A2N5UCX8_9BASI|nr:hypothetical protein PCANC_19056 [Puccinia coronata f. sp. avenae]